MKDFFNSIINFFRIWFGFETINKPETIDLQNSNENNNNETDMENINSEDINLGQTSESTNDCNIVILIDNGHGNDTSGKRSPYSLKGIKPELEFYEYKWNREIANGIYGNLKSMGYDVRLLVTEENDISLKERVNRVNKICNSNGSSNVLLVSIHSNAAGNGSEWKEAKGWSAYTTKGKTKSDTLAEFLYDEAEKNFVGRKIRTDKSDGDRDWENDFYIIKNTYCPAVLTENFFYDNIDDLKYILSKEGKASVIKTHVDGIINYTKYLK